MWLVRDFLVFDVCFRTLFVISALRAHTPPAPPVAVASCVQGIRLFSKSVTGGNGAGFAAGALPFAAAAAALGFEPAVLEPEPPAEVLLL